MSSPINREVFDSRDLIEYREELEQEILEAYVAWAEDHNEFREEEQDELEIPEDFVDIEYLDEEAFTITCEDLLKEYEEIKEFCQELDCYSSDFQYGEAIIHEDYFEEYCKDFCDSCGFIPRDLPAFIQNNIDWSGVADDMEQDYTRVTYNGSDYLIR